MVLEGMFAPLVAAVVAVAPWSAPHDVSPPAEFISTPAMVFAGDGSGVAAWNTGEPARGQLATPAPDGSVVQRGRLGGEVVAGPLRYGGKRTVILTRTRRATGRIRDALAVRFGTTGDPRGRLRRVGGTHEVFGEDQGPAMAVSGSEVAVAWVEKRGLERHRYRIAFSHRGGRFSKPRTLATTLLGTRDSESIALAYGIRRDLIVAYDSRKGRRSVVVQRTRRRGHGFGKEHVLGDREPLTDLVAASNSLGRVVVAWASQDSGEEASRPWVVRAALRPGARFGPAAVLDPGGRAEFAPHVLRAVVSNEGAATVAWTNIAGSQTAETFPLRTATALPGQPFGAAQEVVPNGVLGGLAADHGNFLLSWTDTPPDNIAILQGPYDVFAAMRQGGAGAFGAPEQVSTPERDDRGPAVAAFAAGRPTVLWPFKPTATTSQLAISSR